MDVESKQELIANMSDWAREEMKNQSGDIGDMIRLGPTKEEYIYELKQLCYEAPVSYTHLDVYKRQC